mgnify:CR=1 FL=1
MSWGTLLERKTILLLDDAAEMHLLIKKALEPMQVNFIPSFNERDLIANIINNVSTLSLVLLDVYMPEKDGFAVFQAIKDRFVTRKFKVAFLTGAKEKNVVMQGLGLKADAYIIKPFTVEDFRDKVRKIVG